MKNIIIKGAQVVDLRVPTSDSLLGSDPFHKKPDYSAVLLTLETNTDLQGISICFNIGAGNDWIAYGVKDLADMIIDTSLKDFSEDPGKFHKKFIDHHQFRWLADGVYRTAVGSIINAMWDLWAKQVQKPLWKLLVDLPPEKIVQCIDWRYLRDLLTPEEALELLRAHSENRHERETLVCKQGIHAYSTAGWTGLTNSQILETVEKLKASGFSHFKMKVGQDLQHDRDRLTFIRNAIGEKGKLYLDANQIWGVDEAIEYMTKLASFSPIWIEEPTARDDVLGYVKIAQALEKYNIGVAGGEQALSPVIFKQLLASGGITHCQIDASRLGGVNDVLAVILMAAKSNTPVCPHGGGIGLCNMITHYSFWDQICVAAHSETQIVEYLDFLQDDAFLEPVKVKNGSYQTPIISGWGLEMHEGFVKEHSYPSGLVWEGTGPFRGRAFIE